MLPPLPSGSQATWKAGTAYEVGWTVAANHGGGYSYRMAPADGPLTEASFGKMALDFVGNSTLRWDGPSNKQTACLTLAARPLSGILARVYIESAHPS